MTDFIHLQVHSEYSIKQGIVRINPLLDACKANKMPAVAITDVCNLFAAVKFYRSSLSHGIKPILGAKINLILDGKLFPLVFLCQNNIGYKNLVELVSKAYLTCEVADVLQITLDLLNQHHQGLIVLSGGRQGAIGQALLSDDYTQAIELAKSRLALLGDRFYLQLERLGHSDDDRYCQSVVKLASELNIPVVATNNVQFLEAADFEAHEARVCIHDGYVLNDKRRLKEYTQKQYFRSSAEMIQLFSDIPEAIQNTVEIAKRCNATLNLSENFLPNYQVPEGISVDDYLTNDAKKGLEKRLKQLNVVEEKYSNYAERLDYELGVIKTMGFSAYFLIVADFIKWAKDNNIPVGPGRGSGAGSLVAYCISITDIDPLAYDLLFERFLNPDRVSLPDFDIDFCMEGRDRVIAYVADKYGHDSVSQIITYGTMAAKAVVRDVGRILDHPYGFVDKLAKLIPFELGITLTKALRQEPELLNRYQNENEVRELFDLAIKLEGITRNAGKHAGGVVIAPSKLTDYAPLYCEPGGGNLVTQFDKDDVEAIGLVKFDFLGLRTLTIIQWSVDMINAKNEGKVLSILDIELADEKTFTLLKNCNTTAIFQLESRGMKDLIKRLQPDCFEDIIALVALFRPGPLQSGMVDDFINRKHGREKIIYPHPSLEEILKPTYGVILYQEQVMQIAQVLSNFSLGSADLLRRAMGKKKVSEMEKQRSIFIEGAKENAVPANVSGGIFDLIEKFAGYGFNKSHSAAYALLSYQTAWLKTHYPAEFMASVLSSDMDNTDKMVSFVNDCKANKMDLLPPSVNRSAYKFTVNKQGQIRYGLGAIKGVGESAVHGAIEQREEKLFEDFSDFVMRIDCKKANKRTFEALIKSGALDCFKESRATLFASIEMALQASSQASKELATGQENLFAESDDSVKQLVLPTVSEWSDKQRLNAEKETLGFYLSGHPFDEISQETERFVSASIAGLRPAAKGVLIAGMIVSSRTMITKRGRKIAFCKLDDTTSTIDVAIFSKVLEGAKDLLINDQVIVVKGVVSHDDFSGGNKIVADEIYSLEEARHLFIKQVSLSLKKSQFTDDFCKDFKQIINPFLGGKALIKISYVGDTHQCELLLGSQWRVYPNLEMLIQLRVLLPGAIIDFVY